MRRLSLATLLLGSLLTAAGCSSNPAQADGPVLERGLASWYGDKFHGRRTASGERFDMHDMTAAHRTLPLGTRVRVVNPDNGNSVVVRINDRGPWRSHRIIDVSRAAAEKLGIIRKGQAKVVLHAAH